MHVPDGFLDTKTWMICLGTAGIGLAVVVHQANREVRERVVPLAATVGAFVFVAQMINFPVGGGTSGHLVGGTLMAVLFGPWLAALVMTVVLLVQCFIFQDGGLLALGANCFNMAFVGVFSGYFVYQLLCRLLPRTLRVARHRPQAREELAWQARAPHHLVPHQLEPRWDRPRAEGRRIVEHVFSARRQQRLEQVGDARGR